MKILLMLKVYVLLTKHEDFVLTVGRGYWRAYIQKHLDMKGLSDEPKHARLERI
jgi:hypothetical protein